MAAGEASPNDFTSVMDGKSHWNAAVLIMMFVILILMLEHAAHVVTHHFGSKGFKRFFQQLKSELMALAVISLLIAVFQGQLQKICLEDLPKGYGKAKGAGYPAEGGYPAKEGYPAEKAYPAEQAYPAYPAKDGGEDSDYAQGKDTVTTGKDAYEGTQGRRLMAAAAKAYCKVPLFSLTTLHNAHLLLFGVAVAYMVYSVGSLLLGLKMVRVLRRKCKGVNDLGEVVRDKAGQPQLIDMEALESSSKDRLPLSGRLSKDLTTAEWKNTGWKLMWALGQQFSWVLGAGPVSPDLYRAVRQCSIDYLNTVTYKVWANGRVEYASGKHYHPYKRLRAKVGEVLSRDKGKPGEHGGQGGHGHEKAVVVKYERTLTLGRSDVDFIHLTSECLEYVFCKQTKADWLLPLVLALLLCLPNAYYFLVGLSMFSLLMVMVIGINLQLIVLHCAVRYERKFQGRQKWHRLWAHYKKARDAKFQVHTGDYKQHLDSRKVGTAAGVHEPDDGVVLLHREHGLSSSGGDEFPRKMFSIGNDRIRQNYYTTHNPDASQLFWLQWPGLVRVLLQINHFINSSVLACLLFSFIFHDNTGNNHVFFQAMAVLLSLNVVNITYVSVSVLPLYAITCTAGKHTPIEVIAAVQKVSVMNHLYRQVQMK